MVKRLKRMMCFMLALTLLFALHTGVISPAYADAAGTYADYNRDFENGLTEDAGWGIKTSSNGWSGWSCCDQVSAGVVGEAGARALKLDFTTVSNDYTNCTYAACIPADLFEQNEYYKVEARVKGIHTTLMEMYVVNATTLTSKNLTQSGIYGEISSTFRATLEPDQGYWILIRAFNTNYGTPSTLYIDSINISRVEAAYTDYKRDFENGLTEDAGWGIKTSSNGWSGWSCCDQVSAGVVGEAGARALKLDFTTVSNDYTNCTYAACIPADLFEQNEYYKVEARVKGIHTTLMEMYVVNATTLTSKNLTQSGIYGEISSTFRATLEPDQGYWILIRAFNTNYGTPSTLYIDSINISRATSIEGIERFEKTNFDAFISDEFFDGMNAEEKADYIELLNSTVLLGNLDTAAGYLSELTSYRPQLELIVRGQRGIGNASTTMGSTARQVTIGCDGLKDDFNKVVSYNGQTFNGRKLSYILLHEFGHAYTRAEWNFAVEEIANFTRLYVMDRFNSEDHTFTDGYYYLYSNEYIAGEDHYRRSDWADQMERNYNAQVANYGVGHRIQTYYNEGIVGALSKIQKAIGWEPFERAFTRYDTGETIIADNAAEVAKFDVFMQILQQSYNELNPSASGNEVVEALGANSYRYLREMINAKSRCSNERQFYTVTFLNEKKDVVDIRVVERGAAAELPSGFVCSSAAGLSNVTANMVVNGSVQSHCDLSIENIINRNYFYGTQFVVSVRNSGQVPTVQGTPVKVSLRIQGKDYDKTFVCNAYTSSIAVNETVQLSGFTFENGATAWNAPSNGNYSVTATVDYMNEIEETDETNNKARLQIPAAVSGRCRIEAEFYDESEGIEITSGLVDDGSVAVKSIDPGDYATYQATVSQSGAYRLYIRAATTRECGKLDVYIDNIKKTAVTITSTGSWSTYQTFDGSWLNLTAGTHTIKLVDSQSNYNLNWFELVPVENQIFIKADAYAEASGIEVTEDPADGGFKAIKSIDEGDYLVYHANVSQAGPYKLNVRASTTRATAALDVYIDGVKRSTVAITNTDFWGTYQTFQGNIINLTAGSHEIRLVDSASKFNLSWFELVPVENTILVEAEDYNTMEGVEIKENIFDGTNAVMSIDANDYMTYDILVPEAGVYQFSVNAATTRGLGRVDVFVDNQYAATVEITSTGNWSTYETFGGAGLNLTAGAHTIKLVDSWSNYNLNWFKLTRNPEA